MNKDIINNVFPEAMENIKDGKCAVCGGPVGKFRDGRSRMEYDISGMCQACQDEVFGVN